MPNPVVHFEIVGGDPKKLQDFYRGLFDWKIDANNPMNYGIVEAQDGRGIGGGVGSDGPEDQGHLTFYVEVDDLQKYLDKATSMGASIVMPPTEVPNMVTFAMFKDPAGHVVGMIKADSP